VSYVVLRDIFYLFMVICQIGEKGLRVCAEKDSWFLGIAG
jgi:hypothetical protein